MKNEIHRKLTSIILATIMVAGGVTFAIPGAVPEAAAQSTDNRNLYVSAENPDFSNVFSGLNVVEVVVRDSDINFRGDSDDEPSAEPRVEVDGDQLRMVQGNDGNWYGYFAAASVKAHDTDDSDGLDYGVMCMPNDGSALYLVNGSAVVDDNGRIVQVDDNGNPRTLPSDMLPLNFISGSFATDDIFIAGGSCDLPVNDNIQNVIKTVKDVSRTTFNFGSVNLDFPAAWPFIQVYSFDDESDIDVEYQKGGGNQIVTLYYDSDPDEYGTELMLGRDRYTQGGGVIMTMTDLAMNVDPTDEDTWTFDTTSKDAYYRIFNDDGKQQYAGMPRDGDDLNDAVDRDLQGIDDNLYLMINRNAENADVDAVEIMERKDGNQNDGGRNSDRDTVAGMDYIVTFIETGSNTGVFTNTDSDSDTPNVVVSTMAKRGTSAVVDHNDSTQSVVVGYSTATITLDDDAVGGVWNSGEEIPVTLTDADVNRKAMADEDIAVNDPDFTIIPSVRIGSPITLAGADSAMVDNTNLDMVKPDELKPGTFATDRFSDVARLMPNATTTVETIKFVNVVSAEDLRSVMVQDSRISRTFDDVTAISPSAAFQFVNFDVRSIGEISKITFEWMNSTGAMQTTPFNTDKPVSGDKSKGLVDITSVLTPVLDDTKGVGANTKVNMTLGVAINIDDDDNCDGTSDNRICAGDTYPIVVDLFSFGQKGDGTAAADRINNAIYRLELEENGDNTGVFEGTMEYVMLNQLNVRNPGTYAGIDPISDGIVMIVHNDMTDEDSIRVNYLDLGADGVATQIADQVEAPTTSGSVSFDADNYKVADTVTVTLEDADLNTAVDTIEIYTVVGTTPSKKDPTDSTNPVYDRFSTEYNAAMDNATAPRTQGPAFDMVGYAGYGFDATGSAFGRVLDITFDDQQWRLGCMEGDSALRGTQPLDANVDNGLGETGFTLIETGADTGVFTGDFQIPLQYCHRTSDTTAEVRSTTGVDMEVNYVDYRDASGENIEVGDSAGIRANTGSVSLDRTVYPVPFGVPADYGPNLPQDASIFPIHATGIRNNQLVPGTYLPNGDLTIHIRVNDPDFDVSASGEDQIAVNIPRGGQNAQTPADILEHGPIMVTVSRGASSVIIATAGGTDPNDGRITTLGTAQRVNPVTQQLETTLFDDVRVFNGKDVPARIDQPITRELGPITEIAPDAGIFELDLTLRYTDGPAGSQCPTTSDFVGLGGREGAGDRTSDPADSRFTDSIDKHCIQQGDILTVEYTDPTDASGNPNTVTDSATFDLRNGVLQSDKSVYIIGQDMILTLIEPDLDLESDEAETYDLDLIEWDSDAAGTTMGNRGGGSVFDPEPSDLRETGDSTGIFQVVVEIPEEINNNRVERGEEIELEYTDYGPSGADYVGDDTEDVNLTVFTSNFGATIELDQKVYTWTDKVYITIVAPDHNFDSDLVDEIGETNTDPIRVSTRGNELNQYRLVETGTDTGIFAGEVILTGFNHDADGDTTTGNNGYDVLYKDPSGTGPTDGELPTSDDDGITVSFEFSEDETVVTTALVRWNIGEVQWLETSYPAQGTGIVRVIDRDMNHDPESVDNFGIDVYSDSDSGGIDLTVTETNEATGVFEGTVFFTTTDESSGHRLRVAEGDTITAEYTDGTLPNPYSTNDDIDVSAAAIIGTIVPPLERAPVSNARVVDSFGNTLASVSVDQQVQVTADVINGQDRTQSFAYLVQIQDANGVTVSLSWIEGSLNPGQSLSPAQSWTPDMPGSYTATVFVWESVDNPTALSPPGTVTVNVR